MQLSDRDADWLGATSSTRFGLAPETLFDSFYLLRGVPKRACLPPLVLRSQCLRYTNELLMQHAQHELRLKRVVAKLPKRGGLQHISVSGFDPVVDLPRPIHATCEDPADAIEGAPESGVDSFRVDPLPIQLECITGE